MAPILAVGSNAALLEGVAQMLAAAGHAVRSASTLAEALVIAGDEPPLVAVVERELAGGALALPLAAGGARLLYHGSEGEAPSAPLPLRVQRATLADVVLPLERHRLLALVQSVTERQQATGRERRGARASRERPPEA